jgi:CheY-like chemotaxis protein
LEYPLHSGVSVLVAENRESARSSLAELLRYEGHRVFEAQDRGEAIAFIEANPDLRVLLVDLYMRECASIIEHAQLKLPRAFVVGMGAWNFAPAPSISSATHVCLSKPLVFADVRTAINDHLAGSTKK